MAFQDMTGRRFGRLWVMEHVGTGHNRSALWRCWCECGSDYTTTAHSLRVCGTKSCGCLQKESARRLMTKHGGYQRAEYQTWENMRARCLNKNHRHYSHYGGRGIAICERWNEFSNFYEDMGPRRDGMSLDRIDNDGPYSPENCRWATVHTQLRNRRNTKLYEMNGERMTAGDWAVRYGISYNALIGRLKRGHSLEASLNWH